MDPKADLADVMAVESPMRNRAWRDAACGPFEVEA